MDRRASRRSLHIAWGAAAFSSLLALLSLTGSGQGVAGLFRDPAWVWLLAPAPLAALFVALDLRAAHSRPAARDAPLEAPARER